MTKHVMQALHAWRIRPCLTVDQFIFVRDGIFKIFLFTALSVEVVFSSQF